MRKISFDIKSTLKFLISSWTGRILAINTVLFVIITVFSGSLFAPSSEVLLKWGAKDPVTLAQGEWWRLLVPIFLHFGILHFALNSLALKVIGTYLEPLVGGFWFLVIYFGGGVFGNILSSLMNLAIGAGASGSIFALIGLGVVIEQVIFYRETSQLKIRMGPFSYMTLLNIAFAVVFNLASEAVDGRIGIDNSAHIGGLLGGLLLGLSMIFLKKNRLVFRNLKIAVASILVFLSLSVWGSYKIFETPHIYKKLVLEAEQSEKPVHAYFHYTRALQIDNQDPLVRFKRGEALIYMDEPRFAFRDLVYASRYEESELLFEDLHERLLEDKRFKDADWVMKIFKNRTGKLKLEKNTE